MLHRQLNSLPRLLSLSFFLLLNSKKHFISSTLVSRLLLCFFLFMFPHSLFTFVQIMLVVEPQWAAFLRFVFEKQSGNSSDESWKWIKLNEKRCGFILTFSFIFVLLLLSFASFLVTSSSKITSNEANKSLNQEPTLGFNVHFVKDQVNFVMTLWRLRLDGRLQVKSGWSNRHNTVKVFLVEISFQNFK